MAWCLLPCVLWEGMSQSENTIRHRRHLWWGTCPGLKSLCIFCECEERKRVIACHRVHFKVKEITERNYVSLKSITKPSLQTTLLPRLLHRAVGMAGGKSENSHQSKTRITLLWTQTWLVHRSQTPFLEHFVDVPAVAGEVLHNPGGIVPWEGNVYKGDGQSLQDIQLSEWMLDTNMMEQISQWLR